MAQLATMEQSPNQTRWLFLVQGVLATFLGIGLLFMPAQTLFAIVIALGIYWFIRGVGSLLYIAIDRSAWGWKAFVGALGIVAGVLAMTSPLVTGTIVFTVFIYIIGFQALISGGMELYYGVDSRRASLILLGVVSILLGIALILNPWLDIGALVVFAGAVALVGGIVTIVAALRGSESFQTAPV